MRYNRPRRNKFRSNDRGFRSNDRGFRRNGSQDLGTGGINSTSKNFQRTFFGRNGLKAEKLLEKYNGLAKEALSSGDKILSESYFQHADHFLRVVENQNSIQKNSDNKIIIKDEKNSSSQQPQNSDSQQPQNSDSQQPQNSDSQQPQNSDSQQPQNNEEI